MSNRCRGGRPRSVTLYHGRTIKRALKARKPLRTQFIELILDTYATSSQYSRNPWLRCFCQIQPLSSQLLWAFSRQWQLSISISATTAIFAAVAQYDSSVSFPPIIIPYVPELFENLGTDLFPSVSNPPETSLLIGSCPEQKWHAGQRLLLQPRRDKLVWLH